MSGWQGSNLRALASKASEINRAPLHPVVVAHGRIELPPLVSKTSVLTGIRMGIIEEKVRLELTNRY